MKLRTLESQIQCPFSYVPVEIVKTKPRETLSREKLPRLTAAKLWVSNTVPRHLHVAPAGTVFELYNEIVFSTVRGTQIRPPSRKLLDLDSQQFNLPQLLGKARIASNFIL